MKKFTVLIHTDLQRQTPLHELIKNGLLKAGEELAFRYEPWEKHDKNAIALYCRDGSLIGYLPADISADVCEKIGNGVKLRILVEEVDDDDNHAPKITVSISE